MAVVGRWWNHLKNLRSIAQPGRAHALGAWGRESESRYSDDNWLNSPLLRARPVAFGQRWTGGMMKPAIKR